MNYRISIIIFTGLIITLIGYAIRINFMFNITPSMPVGFYSILSSNDYHQGDIVAVCLKKYDANFGIERGYIFTGARCGNTEPLIKEILGTPSDEIDLENNSISINGQKYLYQTFDKDSKNRPLPSISRGLYRNQGYWLIGTHDLKSWDSRYWGPVEQSQILFKLKPLLTFNDRNK